MRGDEEDRKLEEHHESASRKWACVASGYMISGLARSLCQNIYAIRTAFGTQKRQSWSY